ncbi:MAG: DUF1080 domain-containing protein [Saprospiraceae bacterium]
MREIKVLSLLSCLVFLSLMLTNCSQKKLIQPKKENTLTQIEKADGWILLFDGQTSDGWRAYKKDYFPSGWIIEQGAIKCLASGNTGGSTEGGDIIYNQKYDNFHLKLDWKISKAGNSGVFYRAKEKLDYIWKTAPEFQILDNENYSDADLGVGNKRKAGALYDLISAVPQNANKYGEWNQIEILAQNDLITYKMNGEKILSFRLWTQKWNDMVAKSKFPELNPDWANVAKNGYIGFQDHGDNVWFRNIKIKEL